MYELDDEVYNLQKFSYTKTKLCLIEIRKNILFIFQSLKKPNRKLNDKELHGKVRFSQVRSYNLDEAKVGLSPVNVPRSKYWSKKTPIVLRNLRYLRTEYLSSSSNTENQGQTNETLFLFARTCRSKEEWFYRFTYASQLNLWKDEIQYQLERDQTVQSTKQISVANCSRRTNSVTDPNEDQRYQQCTMKFLERSDRFTALDQLSYIKPVEIMRKVLPKFSEKKTSVYPRELNKDIPLLSYQKQQYCEQWLEKQSHGRKTNVNPMTNESNRDINTNRSFYRDNVHPYQSVNHPLLYFVFKYLQQIPHEIENPILLLNAFFTRCFLDLFDNEEYLARMQSFLQKQLGKIKFSWIEHIFITNLDLGDRLPEIKVSYFLINITIQQFRIKKDVFKLWMDEHGFWSRIKIAYNGKLQLNLNIKLKWRRKSHLRNQKLSTTSRESKHILPQKTWRQHIWPPNRWFRRQSCLSRAVLPKKTISATKTTRMTLIIKFELNHLHGVLLLNIPPIPSDRLWISFLDMPTMQFSATPHFGEYRMPFYRVKVKLEEKLRETFRRYLVMPNMKDMLIPTIHDYIQENGFTAILSSNAEH
ncbi:unnamed protein product [Adineta ricciae]|uniref:SMP-LTD domain-containing protein n=1 Tax=Adineta ricciae TaxID=249248 RepID=A0A815DUE5_ADIRI|nr:unnamed protein product [Adineta ricciae]CAF1302829.1 unnamed protein product [Adineta ricciae]